LIDSLKKYWRAETGIFLAIWLVLLIGGRSRLFRDPGTFWHTVVGEKLLATHHFDNTDSFTWSFGGQPWIPHQWLGECTMAALHAVAGLDSLLLATATLLAALLTWCAARLMRSGVHWSLALMFMILGFGASASHLHVRPHLVTIALLACTVGLLIDVEGGRVRAIRLAWLVPLFLIWTNVHGGMLGGLATVGFVFGWWSLGWLLGKQSPVTSARQVVWLAGLLLACGLTAFANPYGAEVPRTWLAILDSPILPSIITEHRPLEMSDTDGMLVLLLAAVYFTALACLKPQWPRATWLVPLLWLAQAFLRIRHAPLFAFTALLALADVLPQTRLAAWAQRHGDLFQPPIPATPYTWRQLLLPVSAVLLVAGLQTAAVETSIPAVYTAQLDRRVWPTELLDDLRAQEDEHPEGLRVFNDYDYGGFLIYFTPRLKPFVDDRCELFGDRWLLEFVTSQQHGTADRIRDYQQRYGNFDLALVRTGSGFDAFFESQSDWQLIRKTGTATLYRRKELLPRPAPTARLKPQPAA